MKRLFPFIILLCFLLVVSSCRTIEPNRKSYNINIQWIDSTRKFITPGIYARVKEMNDGNFIMVYDCNNGNDDDIFCRISKDKACTWGPPVLVSHDESFANTNSEVIQLQNGWLLYAWTARPTKHGLCYLIKSKISMDYGNTWDNEQTLYKGDTLWINGVWEPAMIQLPTGEIQLFFSNESVYRHSNEQEISMMRSFDNGLTWTVPMRVSYRPRHRDGMAVPIILKNNKGIAVVIEDTGLNFYFKPSVFWTSMEDNWTTGAVNHKSSRRWGALAGKGLPFYIYAGAPYIVQLPGGETLLSVQSSEGRVNFKAHSIMQVYVGNDEAKSFSQKSTPFPYSSKKVTVMWNSLSVINDSTILAVGSVNGLPENNGIWTVKGKIIRK